MPGQPGPNMRAAGYQVQQQQKTAGQTSIIMPIYTFAIVAFFIFTIVKIVMKKTNRNVEKPLESDPIFCEKVFKQPDEKKSKLGKWQPSQIDFNHQRDEYKFLSICNTSGWKDHNASKRIGSSQIVPTTKKAIFFLDTLLISLFCPRIVLA